jgi:hypothetical protein
MKNGALKRHGSAVNFGGFSDNGSCRLKSDQHRKRETRRGFQIYEILQDISHENYQEQEKRHKNLMAVEIRPSSPRRPRAILDVLEQSSEIVACF